MLQHKQKLCLFLRRKKSPSNDYHLQKQNQKELRKITRRIEQLEAEMEELDQKIQDITETMHSTNDAADLVQLQSELDQLTVQQEAVMEEWAETVRAGGIDGKS